MLSDTERIQYLTNKAQKGVITSSERNELANLLGQDPQEFEGSDGLMVLIGIALAAIAVAIIAAIIAGFAGKSR